jgi:PHS family inorganic phosphate transporter-like MFS transporter
MMATIFLMQPVAYWVVSVLVLVLLVSLERSSGLREEIDHQRAAIAVDKLWRYLVGLGGIPALITLFLRAGMYESPRYSFDITEETPVDEVRWHFMESDIRAVSYLTASRFLRHLGNWRHLAGISICAFILNAAIGSLGGDNYRVLAQTWDFSDPQTNTTSLYAWNDVQSRSASVGEAIYKVIFDMSLHSIYTMSIVSVVGSLILIILVEHCPRRTLLIYPSLALAIVFAILATFVQKTVPTTPVTEIAATILCYGIFNIGSLPPAKPQLIEAD